MKTERIYLFVHLSKADGIVYGRGKMSEFDDYCQKHKLSPRCDVTIVDGEVLKPEGVTLC